MISRALGRAIRSGVIGIAMLCSHGAVLCAGASAPGTGLSTAGGFSTRLATFTPQPWDALAGWSRESHAEVLGVFQQTCLSLQRRATWRSVCAQARTTGTDAASARMFFEREFVPYRVTPIEQGKEGLMTGYFEPFLDGSAVRQAPFLVPVYGQPADLLYLDARRWQGLATDGTVQATISERQVDPLAAGEPGLQVDPAVFDSQPLDRRFRVRRDGNRIVTYWSRQQIEAGTVIDAPVIAWVDDPQALYLMQVQGSGQIRMAGGKTLRVSYADQNGLPFLPRGNKVAAAGTRTRGLPGGTTGTAGEPVAVATPVSMRTLSMVTEPTQEEVDRVVDALLGQPQASPKPSPPVRKRGQAAVLPGAPGDIRARMNLGYLLAARTNDPSYIFFQPSSADGGGPVGALGIPLTATRSIAVDPRSTPLGAPVFIEADRDEPAGPLRRLMIAQDTGGAIRGAVRADFFWGSGPKAGAQALRTKDALVMWVLLPKNFSPPRGSATRTRGIGGIDGAAAECVIPDAEYCLE